MGWGKGFFFWDLSYILMVLMEEGEVLYTFLFR